MVYASTNEHLCIAAAFVAEIECLFVLLMLLVHEIVKNVIRGKRQWGSLTILENNSSCGVGVSSNLEIK